MADHKSRLLLWLFGIPMVLAIIAVGLLLFGVGRFDFVVRSNEAEALSVTYRAAGLPWQAKDLRLNPPVPDKDNAAPLLRAIFESTVFKENRDLIVEASQKGKQDELRLQIDKNRALYLAAERAIARPKLDLGIDPDAAATGGHDGFQELLDIARLEEIVCARAVSRASRGDAAGCAQDVELAWRIVDWTAECDSILGLLQYSLASRITSECVEHCAEALQGDPRALTSLLSITRRHSDWPDVKRGLLGKSYQELAWLRNAPPESIFAYVTGAGPTQRRAKQSSIVRSGLPEGVIERAEAAKILRFSIEAMPTIDAGSEDPFKLAHALDSIAERVFKRHVDTKPDADEEAPYSYVRLLRGMVDACLSKRETEAAIACLIARDETGKWPGIVPGSWTDPYHGKPLKIEHSPKRLQVTCADQAAEKGAGVEIALH